MAGDPSVRRTDRVHTFRGANMNRKLVRRANDGVLIACIVAIAITSYNAVEVFRVQHRQAVQQQHLGYQYQQLVQACERLNLLRAEDNVSHFADYKVYKIVYQESVAAERRRMFTPNRRKDAHAFLSQLRTALRVKEWTPETNCRRAVNRRGAFYRPAHPIPFYKRLPPRYDLYPPENSAALKGG